MEQIGHMLRRYRLERGLSKRALAGHLGVSSPTVMRWESGESAPNDYNLHKLQALLEHAAPSTAGISGRAARAVRPAPMTATIERLSVSGFKSFRRRVTVSFHPGFTAIVGENGTGKSNIFDALTFVMGRRSRALRAERVEQLLHAPPSGDPVEEAEVAMTIAGGRAAWGELLPEAADQVNLSRRIAASSSTYRLQGRTCPARTVEALLGGIHVDPNGFHIVEQGMVVDILERSPKRRREILDEVAGVAAYEERKAKAIAELGQVKERLNTSRILLAERRQRLAELHRQREAALEHRTITQEKDRLAATLQRRRWEALARARDKAEADAARVRDEVEALTAQVGRLDREVEALERTWSGPGETQDDTTLQLVRTVERLRGELSAKEAEEQARRRELAASRETLGELGRWVERPTRRPEPVTALLELKWPGVMGTIGELIRPRRDTGLALETAMGGHRHDLVVTTRDLALRCVDHLKAERLGRARFLPLDKLSPPPVSAKARAALKSPGVLGLAVELVDCPTEARAAVAYALGDTLIAESLEAVRHLQGVRVATTDGDLMERGGAIVGGSAQGKRQEPDLGKHKAKIAQLEKELSELQLSVQGLSAQLVEAEGQLQETSKAAAEAKATRSDEEAKLRNLREQRKEVYTALESKRATVGRRERELAELGGELSALGEVPEPDGGMEEGTVEALQARVRQAERRLAELGAVNMRAIEEYDAFLAEFQVFKDRVHTLEREKQEIERFVGEVEAKKRQQFFTVMEAVSTELDKLFRRLFGGGEAGLALAEPENIDSGLLIRARPPAKEPRLLDALSGGEKTLVAIAFVLALAAGRPAPFYLLDEVDAALDMANSERLANLLKDYAREAQVIVISHNEELIRHADRVYGVVMREGASEVVAMDLVGHARS